MTYVEQWKFLRPGGKFITNITELLLEVLLTKLVLSLKSPIIQRIKKP